jgi:hypothetical protein
MHCGKCAWAVSDTVLLTVLQPTVNKAVSAHTAPILLNTGIIDILITINLIFIQAKVREPYKLI